MEYNLVGNTSGFVSVGFGNGLLDVTKSKDFKVISNVTPGFNENLSLGWPPMSWINRFVIIPTFKFLEGFIGNYGIIIVLLVLFVKIVLLPLSYSSYLGMAKIVFRK